MFLVNSYPLAIAGGAIWSIGISLSVIASAKAGPAISYELGQGATVVASLWYIYMEGLIKLLRAQNRCLI